MGFLSVVELEYVMVKAVSHKAPYNIGTKWRQTKLFDRRVVRVSIDDGYLITLDAAVTGVVGKYAERAITAVHDAGILHHDVFGRLKVDVPATQDLLKE
jgi:hypothetical protein